jgi:hypothetical protein
MQDVLYAFGPKLSSLPRRAASELGQVLVTSTQSKNPPQKNKKKKKTRAKMKNKLLF